MLQLLLKQLVDIHLSHLIIPALEFYLRLSLLLNLTLTHLT
jgi:hypothetical protein